MGKDWSGREPSRARRRVVRALGAAAVASFAGCSGSSGSGAGEAGSDPDGGSAASSGPARGPVDLTDGYADRQSYRPGDHASLFLNGGPAGRASLGLYDVNGRRVHQFPGELAAQAPDGSTPWESGFGYRESASLTLPELPSGIYLVERLVPMIVKTAAAAPADIVVLYPSNTEAAYNATGGRSMYSQPDRAPIVSFQRPAQPSLSRFADAFLQWIAGVEMPYRFRYVADVDLEDYNELRDAKLLVIIGHSEYWTRRAREHFDRFVLEGGNALILSGNTMWWQVRYSDDQTQLICYKERPDPIQDPLLKTVNWTDGRLRYPIVPSIGADFPRGGYGIDYPDTGWNGFSVLVPESPVFRGVSVGRGDIIALPSMEYDGAPLLNRPVTDGEPRLDANALGAYRAELIGYDYGFRGGTDTVGTWLAYQRTSTSGIVINGASTDWCSKNGVGGKDAARVRKIVLNMIDLLVNRQPVFVG